MNNQATIDWKSLAYLCTCLMFIPLIILAILISKAFNDNTLFYKLDKVDQWIKGKLGIN